MKSIQRKFPKLGILNPLANTRAQAKFNSDNKPQHIQTNFYLTAVPSYFKDTFGSQYSVYQLTALYEHNFDSPQNMLLFNYELSPISVQFYQDKENIFEFLTHICAVVGGIFTVASIIDAFIHRSVSLIFKDRIGKLQ